MKKKLLIIGSILLVIILITLTLLYFHHKNIENKKMKIIMQTKERYAFFDKNILEDNPSVDKDIIYLNNIIKYQENNNSIDLNNFKTTLFNNRNFKDDLEYLANTINEEIDKYNDSIFLNVKEFEKIIPENLDKDTAKNIFLNNTMVKNIEKEKQKRLEYLNNLKDILNDINLLKDNCNNYYFNDNIYYTKNNDTKIVIDNFNNKYNLNLNIKLEVPITANIINDKLVPILCYHGVLDNPWGIEGLFVKINEFDKQMKYLKDNGYTTLFTSEIASAYLYEKPIIITFDDGYKDVYTNAYPILQKYNLKANSYIISGWINGDVYMTIDMIKELISSPNFEIGSHTVNHKQLANLSEEEILYEIKQSKEDLEQLLKTDINVIAYPVGSYDSRVIKIVSNYYTYALSTDNGKENPYSLNTYNLKRIYVMRNYSINDFINLLQ